MLNVELIVEGNEEETFFEIVREKGLDADKIDLTITNASGATKIPFLFQDSLSNAKYDAVLCVYDVDRRGNAESPFKTVRDGLKKVLGSMDRVDKISICTNPNAPLLFLLGADKVSGFLDEIKTSKSELTPLLHKYWQEIGKSDGKKYKAAAWQLEIMKFSFDAQYKYDDVLANAKDLSKDYLNDCPATNVLPLLQALKEGRLSYFKEAISIKAKDNGV